MSRKPKSEVFFDAVERGLSLLLAVVVGLVDLSIALFVAAAVGLIPQRYVDAALEKILAHAPQSVTASVRPKVKPRRRRAAPAPAPRIGIPEPIKLPDRKKLDSSRSQTQGG